MSLSPWLTGARMRWQEVCLSGMMVEKNAGVAQTSNGSKETKYEHTAKLR